MKNYITLDWNAPSFVCDIHTVVVTYANLNYYPVTYLLYPSCSVPDLDPFGSGSICRIRIQICNYNFVRYSERIQNKILD